MPTKRMPGTGEPVESVTTDGCAVPTDEQAALEAAENIVKKFPQIEQEVIAPLLRRSIGIAILAQRQAAVESARPGIERKAKVEALKDARAT